MAPATKLEFYEGTEVSHNTPTLPSTTLCEKNIRIGPSTRLNLIIMNQNLLSQTFVQSNSFSQQDHFTYCKSTNFGVLLYLANLANCVSSLIFVAANIYVDRTLHRRAAGRRQI